MWWKRKLVHGKRSAYLGEAMPAEHGYFLSADFAEWLTALPKNWTDPNVSCRRIDFAAWETLSYQLLRHALSLRSGIV
jgi:hypothetical protein